MAPKSSTSQSSTSQSSTPQSSTPQSSASESSASESSTPESSLAGPSAPEPLALTPCAPIREHAALVMTWRNDPTTLAMFYHHEPKVWESFWPEFRDEYFTDPALPPTFALDGERAVAFLRFERVDDESCGAPAVDISVNVDPEARGRGLGVGALLGARAYLRERGVGACWAEIRSENEASQRAFIRAGWRPVDELDKTIVDTGETCRIRRFVVSP